jgi:hypothetical protein
VKQKKRKKKQLKTKLDVGNNSYFRDVFTCGTTKQVKIHIHLVARCFHAFCTYSYM